ncbi:hypothetical protein [Nocardioides conyzicola]|uniref:FlgD Ig-like domain-containing protein n=1 Tax=Nocardioides conyzicola TaxID=1651781 RepID=A0ABP8XE55_9ACTN
MKIPTTVMALMMLVAGLLTAAPAVADPASEVTVVWPEVTRFNPTTYSYDAVVSNSGAGHLFSTWGYDSQMPWLTVATPVPESGHVTLGEDQEGIGRLLVWSCTTEQWNAFDGTCTQAASSPDLQAWSHIAVVNMDNADVRGPGLNHARIYYGPQPPTVDTPEATWELLDGDRLPFAVPVTGELGPADLVVSDFDGLTTIPFTVPAGLPNGHYYLDVRMTVDSADFGPLQGSMGAADGRLVDVIVDSVAPQLKVTKPPTQVYPVRDSYLDAVVLRASTDEQATGTLDVTDSAGKRVFHTGNLRLANADWSGDSVYWNGRTSGGALVPEGTYTMVLTATDAAGNTDTWSGRIAVSHKKVQWTVFKRTVTAAASRSGKPFVGRCSTLASPARGGPRGSLGFYSQTKCAGDSRSGTVATNHGMYIPKAFDDRYAWARVTLNGGPATASADNYLVLGYLSPRNGRLVNTRILGKGHRAHPGLKVDVGSIWDRKKDKPYILWSNGLTAGSRYDVRSYTVEVRYRMLR